jgi:hypothetical protein
MQMATVAKPSRQIQSAEILSSIFPPGATVMINDDDEVVAYTGRLPVIPTVTIMRRAGAGLADSGSDNGHDDHDYPPFRPNSPNPSASVIPASQSILSSQTSSSSSSSYQLPRSSHPFVPPVALSNEVLTRLSTRSVVTATRGIAYAPSPPPTIANSASRAVSPAPFNLAGPSRSGDDTWVYHRSTYVASPTVAMSSPERSPERPPLSAPPRNNASQASGSQPSLSQLPVSYQ